MIDVHENLGNDNHPLHINAMKPINLKGEVPLRINKDITKELEDSNCLGRKPAASVNSPKCAALRSQRGPTNCA